MARLERFTRAVEKQSNPAANFDAALAHERAISRQYGGRTVMDDRKRPAASQPSLFLKTGATRGNDVPRAVLRPPLEAK